MIDSPGETLVWLLPVLGVSIWLQRGASFLVPKKHLQRPLLHALNQWAPMAIITVLVLVSLNTGLAEGWRGPSFEIAILAVSALLYVLTRQVLVAIVAAALVHWAVSTWL